MGFPWVERCRWTNYSQPEVKCTFGSVNIYRRAEAKRKENLRINPTDVFGYYFGLVSMTWW